MAIDLLSIGDASLDVFLMPSESEAFCELQTHQSLICFNYGDKIPVKTLDFSIGGNAANNAVGTRRLGVSSAAVLTLGADDNGTQVVDKLRSEGVDTTYVFQQAATTTNYSVVINYSGERTIFSYKAPRSYEFPLDMAPAPWVYLTSLGDTFRPFYNHLISWLNKYPATKLVYNPGSRQLRAGTESMQQILQRTYAIFVNRQEAEAMTAFGDSSGKAKELLSALSKLGPKLCVITDGGNGAYLYDGQRYLKSGVMPIDAYERTGAGDAFGAGFLAALVRGSKLEDALKWGTLNSASVIGYIGSQKGLLTEEMMGQWMMRASSVNLKVEEI